MSIGKVSVLTIPMITVYILKSLINDKFYVGQTSNLKRRLMYHNSGYSKATRAGIPWQLIYSEIFESRVDAVQREREIKKQKSRKYILNLVGERPA